MQTLANIADYVSEKINSRDITLEQYVTTDSLLQDKRGRERAQNLPPVSCNLTHFKKGDVLVANIRPYLKKIWYADTEGGCSSDVLAFRAKERSNSDFLYAILMADSFYSHAMVGAKGSKMPRGDKDQIMRYKLPILSNVKNIGKMIVDIDSKISLNRAINHNLEAMAKQLYDYWFVQFDFPNEEGKPYKSSGGKMVWNGKLNREMPEGWGVEKIKDIANTYSGGTPKSTEMEYYENGNIPWINSGELNKPIITNTSNFITQSGLDNSSAKLYPSNAILIALYGATAGKVSLLSFEACSNQAICGIILNDSVMLDYTRLYLSSLYEHFITLSTGSARDNISQDTVKNTNVIMPQKEVLVSFNQIIRKTTEMLVKNLVEITSLTKQRDELLPLLMNGQVSVNYDLSHD